MMTTGLLFLGGRQETLDGDRGWWRDGPFGQGAIRDVVLISCPLLARLPAKKCLDP